ncbi:hypothetical protein STEG23_024540, partial [Scotinomys teguina]
TKLLEKCNFSFVYSIPEQTSSAGRKKRDIVANKKLNEQNQTKEKASREANGTDNSTQHSHSMYNYYEHEAERKRLMYLIFS